MLKRKLIILTSLIFLLCSSLTAFASEPATGTEGFIERLYGTCFGRSSDAEGKAYWLSEVEAGSTASDLVLYFYGSQEYANKAASDAEFVESLYYTMMNRGSDEGGMAYWLDIASSGCSRDYLIKGFIGSEEFGIICSNYGIQKGSVTLTNARDQNINTTKFVQRLYSTCLGREADAEGLDYWCSYVNSGQMTGAVLAQRFFESAEYIAMNKDNAAYIEDLYITLMDRSSDADGLYYWEVQLSYGYSRLEILKRFAGSEEFTIICADYGIERGSIDVVSELSEEMQLVKLINAERAKAGLPELVVDELSNARATAYITYSIIDRYTDENYNFNSYEENYLKELNLSYDNTSLYFIITIPGVSYVTTNPDTGDSAGEAFDMYYNSGNSSASLWGSESEQFTKIGVGTCITNFDGVTTKYWAVFVSYENAIPEPEPVEPTMPEFY